jgi:hypothetical protein
MVYRLEAYKAQKLFMKVETAVLEDLFWVASQWYHHEDLELRLILPNGSRNDKEYPILVLNRVSRILEGRTDDR